MKNRIKVVFLFALLFAFYNSFCSEKPNVVFIVLDDLNDYLGVMDGHPQALTPHLDKLANEGVLFENAHSNAPICAPSRSSFMSGIYPSTSGNYAFNNWQQNEVLINSKLLPEYFKENGYRTYKAGKINHHKKNSLWDELLLESQYQGPVAYNGVEATGHPSVPEPYRNIGVLDGTFASLSDVPSVPASDSAPGYTGWWNSNSNTPFRFINENNRDKLNDEITVERFAKKIKELEQVDFNEPFFMALGLMRPHTPLVVPQKYYDMFPLEDVQIPLIKENDNDDCKYDEVLGGKGRTAFVALKDSYTTIEEGLRAYLQGYLASVAFADDMVGQILAALDSTHFKENTIVVLFSDHGYNMGEKDYLFKNSLWEESTRIPLIFRVPGNEANAGKRIVNPVGLIDVYPTLADLCQLNGSTKKNEKGAELDGFSLKPLIQNPEEAKWAGPNVALSMVANKGSNAPEKQNFTVRSNHFRYVRYWNGSEELYDHTNDSYEWTNIADDSAYFETKAALKNALIQLIPTLATVTDPLNDFSMVLEKSSNMSIEKSNSGNFNEDTARCVRTNSSVGYLVYEFEDLSDFNVDFWIVDENSGNIKVYGSVDGSNYTEIETKLSGPKSFGYRSLESYSPANKIPKGVKYLKVELSGGNGSWKGQIGSVSMFAEKAGRSSASTFYIDKDSGSDYNSGTSPGEAWKSLERVNQEIFIPGDTLLFKSGNTFYGSIKLQGSGTKQKPIIVGKFGGDKRPVIDAAGYLAGINLENAGNIYFNDLEITSNGEAALEGAAKVNRYGVYVVADEQGEFSNLQFNNLDIHHIFATQSIDNDGQNPTSNMGMGFNISMQNKNALIKNIRIENCRIAMVGHTGIKIFGNGESGKTYYLDSVQILNNRFEHIGGPGMVPGRCSNVIVRGNVVNYSGSNADPRMHNRGSGIWPWTSKNVLIEKNKFMHAWGKYDSCGAHIDFNCSNVIVQYNLSFDNAGGFVEILGNDVDCAYRYNVSINDGYRKKGVGGALADGHIFWVNGYVGSGNEAIGANNNQIYNNTIYVAPHIKTGINISHQTYDNRFENNIIYVAGEMEYDNQGKNNIFDNNLWYGNIPEMPHGDGAIFANPMFVNVGDTLPESYKITTNSLAFGTGKTIADDLEYDFWNQPIPEMYVNRGADQTRFEKAFYTVNSSANKEGGSILPAGELSIPELVDVPFHIKVKPGFFLKEVLVDGNPVEADSVYTFTNLSANHSIEAMFFAPADSVFDPLDNFNIVSEHSNFKIQTDNTQNFLGDSGRAQRINTDTGALIYNYKEITAFEIDFWTVNNDNTSLAVFISEDGVSYTEIGKKTIDVIPLNNRKRTTYTAGAEIPEGTNFIKFEVTNGASMWQGQIGSVNLKWLGDERLPTSYNIQESQKPRVYPNPVEKTLFISGLKSDSLARIFSVNGTFISSAKVFNEMDVSFLESGIYFLHVDNLEPVRFVKL